MRKYIFYAIEFDDALNKLEESIQNVAMNVPADERNLQQMFQSITNGNDVAFFWSDCNKWIRVVVQFKDTKNNLANVWAKDYGLPFVATPNQLRIFDREFCHLLRRRVAKRVYLGGIANACPIDEHFNVDKHVLEVKPQRIWSPAAIALMQKMIDESPRFDFSCVGIIKVKGIDRLFGRLMFQYAKEDWVDVLSHLVHLGMGRHTEMVFDSYNLKTVSYTMYENSEGVPFHTKTMSVPTDVRVSALDVPTNKVAISKMQVEENEFFDKSASIVAQCQSFNDHLGLTEPMPTQFNGYFGERQKSRQSDESSSSIVTYVINKRQSDSHTLPSPTTMAPLLKTKWCVNKTTPKILEQPEVAPLILWNSSDKRQNESKALRKPKNIVPLPKAKFGANKAKQKVLQQPNTEASKALSDSSVMPEYNQKFMRNQRFGRPTGAYLGGQKRNDRGRYFYARRNMA